MTTTIAEPSSRARGRPCRRDGCGASAPAGPGWRETAVRAQVPAITIPIRRRKRVFPVRRIYCTPGATMRPMPSSAALGSRTGEPPFSSEADGCRSRTSLSARSAIIRIRR